MGNQKFSHECEPFKLWLSSSLTLISFRFSSNFSPSLLPLVNTPFTPYQSALVSSLFLLSPFIFRMFGCFFLFSKSFAWLRRGLFCLGSTISLNTEVPFQLYSLYLLFSHPFLTCFFPLSFPLSSLCALLFLTFPLFFFLFSFVGSVLHWFQCACHCCYLLLSTMDGHIIPTEIGWTDSSNSEVSSDLFAEEMEPDILPSEEKEVPFARHGLVIEPDLEDVGAQRTFWNCCAIGYLLDYRKFFVSCLQRLINSA